MNALAQVRASRRETNELPAERLMEQRQRESQKMEAIGRLVSGVAHDFNNLLTGIVLCSDLLLAGLEKDSRLRKYAHEVRMAGAQGSNLVQHLLAVAGERGVEPRLLSFNELIRDLRGLLARLIGENIMLSTELADSLRPVKIDPAQAQQIILNLVLNARDSMPDGGRVTLTTRDRGRSGANGESKKSAAPECIEFEVRDTGCGMDAATRARVFEPFFTTKDFGKGNGLGLATVHSIVKENGGVIELRSTPGQGTTIVVLIPRAKTEVELRRTGRGIQRLAAPSRQPGESEKTRKRL